MDKTIDFKELKLITVPHVIRLLGLVFLIFIIAGQLEANLVLSSIWALVMGLSAIYLFKNMEEGGLLKWVGLITWQIIGIIQFIVETVEIIVVAPEFITKSFLVLMPIVLYPILTICHIWALKILLQPEVKMYFADLDGDLIATDDTSQT